MRSERNNRAEIDGQCGACAVSSSARVFVWGCGAVGLSEGGRGRAECAHAAWLRDGNFRPLFARDREQLSERSRRLLASEGTGTLAVGSAVGVRLTMEERSYLVKISFVSSNAKFFWTPEYPRIYVSNK